MKQGIIPKMRETNPATVTYLGINPLAQENQTGSDDSKTDETTNRRADHKTNIGQRAFPQNPIKIIREIREEKIPVPTPPKFIFELTTEAAEKNFLTLKKYNFNLEKAILAQRISPLGYGSEFRPPATLRRIFKHHPLWT